VATRESADFKTFLNGYDLGGHDRGLCVFHQCQMLALVTKGKLLFGVCKGLEVSGRGPVFLGD